MKGKRIVEFNDEKTLKTITQHYSILGVPMVHVAAKSIDENGQHTKREWSKFTIGDHAVSIAVKCIKELREDYTDFNRFRKDNA